MYYKKIIKSILLISIVYVSNAYAEYGYEERYNEPQKSIPARQVIIQNRKTITTLNKRVSELELRLDGISSLIEGLNVTISDMKMGRDNSSVYSNDNSDNTKLIRELGIMIDKINSSYVSKEELQKVIDNKSIVSKSSSKKYDKDNLKVEPSSSSVNKKAISKIYSEGVRLFVKKRYSEAEKRFTITDSKGYKPAASNYYLGEISYYTKNYKSAIFYYKKSVSLYAKASYMDVLLLHTGISLDKTGDKSQAKIFYNNIIENYPKKKSATIAKSRLKKL